MYFCNSEQPGSSVVSIQDFQAEILGSNPHILRRRMNIYTFDIFTNHWIAVEEIDEPNRFGFHLHHLEVGPLNLPEPFHLAVVKEAIWNISALPIPSKWWTGFSTWEDFYGLVRTGTTLPMHSVVQEINTRFERIENGTCTINTISENGDISIDLHEDFPTLLKGYQIVAKRKSLKTLKQIAAFNVAKLISTNTDVQILEIPQSLYQLVAAFLDTHSGDYMNV